MLNRFLGLLSCVVSLGIAPAATAQEVRLTPDDSSVSFDINGTPFVIARVQDPDASLAGEFAKTSRPCPDFCIQPMVPVSGVAPVAELEIITFLQNNVANSTGLLVDARLPDWFKKGALPAAVNIPFAALDAENPFQSEILRALGATQTDGVFDFSNALSLIIYGNGPWDAQGTRAVQSLVDAGYPPALIQNYRGGLEDWLHLGLSTVLP